MLSFTQELGADRPLDVRLSCGTQPQDTGVPQIERRRRARRHGRDPHAGAARRLHRVVVAGRRAEQTITDGRFAFSVPERPAGHDGAPTRRRRDADDHATVARHADHATSSDRPGQQRRRRVARPGAVDARHPGPLRRPRADRRRLAGRPRVRGHRAIPAFDVGAGADRHRAVPGRLHRRRHRLLVRRVAQPVGVVRPRRRRLAGAGGDRPARPRDRLRLGRRCDPSGSSTRRRNAGVRHPVARRSWRSGSAGRAATWRRSACSSASVMRCAAAVWFGGVALVARVVLAGPGEDDLVQAVRGFSRISLPAMLGTIVTGVIQLVRLDGGSLFSSSHGRSCCSRRSPWRRWCSSPSTARQMVSARLDRAQEMTVPLADRFRRAFGAEAAIGVVVLMLSGWLLALTPPRIVETDDANYPVTCRSSTTPPGSTSTSRSHRRRSVATGSGSRSMAPEQDHEPRAAVRSAGRLDRPSGRAVDPQPHRGRRRRAAGRPTGIPLEDAGTWTIELSVVTAIGTLTGATSSFDVGPADDGTGTTGRAADRDQRDRPAASRRRRPSRRRRSGTTGDTTAGATAAGRLTRRLIDQPRQVAKQLLEAHRLGDVELVVAAALRRAVGAPPHEAARRGGSDPPRAGRT